MANGTGVNGTSRQKYLREQALTGLAHELKGPIAAIEGALDVLANESRKQADYLSMVERNASRLKKHVNDLLEMIKGQQKGGLLKFEKIDVASLCRKLADSYHPLALQRKIELRRSGLEKPVHMWGDAQKMEIIISNLLSNSLKFTDAGNVSVSLRKSPESLFIEVSDTGKGISRQEIPFIFDRFFQGQAGLNAKGMGIGLTIAKTWVGAHKGKISASSDGLNKGAKFVIVLPRNWR